MVTRKSNIINSIIVLKRLQNLTNKTTTLAPCVGSTVSKLKYALHHTQCLLPTCASALIKRVTCNHKMCTNAEFQLLLSQQTIQQSISNNTISHATFAKAKFKQRTN